jgi:hypothetical protein
LQTSGREPVRRHASVASAGVSAPSWWTGLVPLTFARSW